MVLNRGYKPLGMISPTRVDYAPYAVAFEGLNEAVAGILSHDGSKNLDQIYLYRDKTHPGVDWNGYQARLAALADLKVVGE